jgi:hypothetical protein
MKYRVHVVPFLRDWLAITVGHDIFTWREMSPVELAHEVEHVRQWNANGIMYVPRYFLSSWRAGQAGKDRYLDNEFEVAARAAATRAAGEGPL